MPSNSSHNGLVPKATNTNRGEHPDLDANGNWRADPWDRRFAEDRVFSGAFMDQVAREQRALPENIQWQVSGVPFAPGGTPSEGVQAYNDYVKTCLHQNALMLRGEWQELSPELQDAYAAQGWSVHDPFNREGRLNLRATEQWSDPFTYAEYNAAVARAKEERR